MKRVKGGFCQRAADRQGVLDHIKLALHDCQELGMGDPPALALDHQMPLEAEGLAQPVDRRRRVDPGAAMSSLLSMFT
jgi:hypothetical protein